MRIHTALAVLIVLAGLPVGAQPVSVGAVVETQPVVRGGTAAEDVAIWPNSGAPDQSLIIVADAAVGLLTYRLDGSEFQALLSDGVAFGVDVHEGFSLPGGTAPLVVVANGTLQSLTAYVVDPISMQLRRVDTGTLAVPSFTPGTVTLYRSAATNTFYVFSADGSGNMQQLELRPNSDGGVDGVPVRNFSVGGAIAGAVADDQQGFLFVAQQDQGIWRYAAEPDGGVARTSVATATPPLTTPLGGLGLYALPNKKGYLLAASAGGNQVLVYDRQPPHTSLGSFMVVEDGGIDAVTGPTTVEATAIAMGPKFPSGMVVVHDQINSPMQNDKLVSWADVANAFTPPLQMSQPDGGTDGGTSDGGTDGGSDGGGLGSLPGSGQTFPPSDSGGGCGCSVASVPGALLLVVAGLALRSRRRQG